MSDRFVADLMPQLAAGDRRAAARHCVGLMGEGITLEELVDEGLAPAMLAVGRCWETAQWTVADEHLATSTAEVALSAAAAECLPTRRRGEVVVTCVEGDWHSLPSRMLAEVLEAHGWAVRFLGASQPTELLVEHVARYRPDAVVLSCAVPMALPALHRATTLLHALDLPVYVGGTALGDSARRAVALGADGWGRDTHDALALLDAGVRRPGPGPSAAATEEYRLRHALLPAWSLAALDRLAATMPAVASYTEGVREQTRFDLEHVLEMACVSLLVDDPSLLREQDAWLRGVLRARGVPAGALPRGVEALVTTRPDGPTAAVTDALAAYAGDPAATAR